MRSLLYCEFFFKDTSAAYNAFKNMGKGASIFGPDRPKLIKMMGTGSGSGFSIIPDFKRYALLFFFSDFQSAASFYFRNEVVAWYLANCEGYLATVLEPVKGHGKWEGESPFDYSGVLDRDEPLAVITRATIRTRRLAEFWWNVPKTASFMKSAPALYQVGIGEYPVFMQATFSIWESLNELRNTAYGDTVHAEIVKKTRERNWYKEELFVEFKIKALEAEGANFQRLRQLNLPLIQSLNSPN